jgi:hypothetical protein
VLDLINDKWPCSLDEKLGSSYISRSNQGKVGRPDNELVMGQEKANNSGLCFLSSSVALVGLEEKGCANAIHTV